MPRWTSRCEIRRLWRRPRLSIAPGVDHPSAREVDQAFAAKLTTHFSVVKLGPRPTSPHIATTPTSIPSTASTAITRASPCFRLASSCSIGSAKVHPALRRHGWPVPRPDRRRARAPAFQVGHRQNVGPKQVASSNAPPRCGRHEPVGCPGTPLDGAEDKDIRTSVGRALSIKRH